MISFELVIPSLNRYRTYRLELTTDLFDNWVLTRTWGRIGKPQRVQRDYFPFHFDARMRARQIVRRRLLHGYAVTHSA